MRRKLTYNLHDLIETLVASQPDINELYLFGSRAYGTCSKRSDCDVIVRFDPASQVKSSDLLEFSSKNCPALDFFHCSASRATSASNDSYVNAATFEDLILKLDAQKLWTRRNGFCDFKFSDTKNWSFEVSEQASFAMTVLPDEAAGEPFWQYKVQKVEAQGLPAMPYIGDTLAKAVVQIIEVSRRMVRPASDLSQRGKAKDGWTVNLGSEYDCQDLFYSVVKPWLPGLAREVVGMHYDDQKKFFDFGLFENKLIIEMKFIDTAPKKAEVGKTLQGLTRFYLQNSNVGALLIIIFVKADVDLDDRKWEADFSKISAPTVTTVIIRVPKIPNAMSVGCDETQMPSVPTA